jgi:hypothetical protein
MIGGRIDGRITAQTKAGTIKNIGSGGTRPNTLIGKASNRVNIRQVSVGTANQFQPSIERAAVWREV